MVAPISIDTLYSPHGIPSKYWAPFNVMKVAPTALMNKQIIKYIFTATGVSDLPRMEMKKRRKLFIFNFKMTKLSRPLFRIISLLLCVFVYKSWRLYREVCVMVCFLNDLFWFHEPWKFGCWIISPQKRGKYFKIPPSVSISQKTLIFSRLVEFIHTW